MLVTQNLIHLLWSSLTPDLCSALCKAIPLASSRNNRCHETSPFLTLLEKVSFHRKVFSPAMVSYMFHL